MSTHRKKRAKTTGTNATNDTAGTEIATANNARSHSQNLTTQVNDDFDMKLSQVLNIQRDQQYQLEILRSENTKLVKKNNDLCHELNQVKEMMELKMNEMKNEFKKQLEEMNKDSTGDSRSEYSVVGFENDELSNTEGTDNVNNIKFTKDSSLHDNDIENVLIFTSKNNEKMIATACRDSHIKITRLDNNKLVKTIENAHSYGITSLAMTKINNTDVLASGGNDGMVKLWSIDNFKEVASFKCKSSKYVKTLAAYELKGKSMLACGLLNGSIELWDVQSKKRVDTLKDHGFGSDALHTFKYQNKTYLLGGDWGGKVLLLDLDDDNTLVKSLCCGNRCVNALATIEFDKDMFIAASVGKKVKLWKMSSLKPYHEIYFHDDFNILDLKLFISNGKVMLAIVDDENCFHVLDIEGKKVVHKVKCTNHRLYSLDVCKEDGNYVFIAGGRNTETKKGSIVFLEQQNIEQNINIQSSTTFVKQTI